MTKFYNKNWKVRNFQNYKKTNKNSSISMILMTKKIARYLRKQKFIKNTNSNFKENLKVKKKSDKKIKFLKLQKKIKWTEKFLNKMKIAF